MLELIAGCLVIVAIWHLTNHNYGSCIWQPWEITSRYFAHGVCQICHRSVYASASIVPPLLNLACALLQNHLHPLLPNPFDIIKIFPRQPGLESIPNIFNLHLSLRWSISKVFETVLSLDYRPMFLLQKPTLPYFLPCVQHIKGGLPHPVGKLLQAGWGFAFGTAEVQPIIELIKCIVFVIGNHSQWEYISNPCNIWPA